MGCDIPDKRYFKIGEVSKFAGVAPHVIRYWETEFDQIAPLRAASKQRLYRREDVERILQVKELLHCRGFTIAGARRLLEEKGVADSKLASAPMNASRKLDSIKQELLQLYEQLQKKKLGASTKS